MRILQLIDSLAPGGAETVAVEYANQLQMVGEESFLCATRAEGLLKSRLNSEVGYLLLERKRTLDLFAFNRLVRFCKQNKIEMIHAHATSFFLAWMLKMRLPAIGFVWHDHYGDSENLSKRASATLQVASGYMDTIISVNAILKEWAEAKLKCNHVVFLTNAVSDLDNEQVTDLKLKGIEGYRIICLANFRAQKDHFNLINAFEQVNKAIPKTSLHLVGKNWEDGYFNDVNKAITTSKSNSHIYYYGPQSATGSLLRQATLGVLSSQSEGLPMALLEYGMAGLAVVSTAVGACEKVINNADYCVPAGDSEALAKSMLSLLKAPEQMKTWQQQFKARVESDYSIQAIIPKLTTIYKNCLKK
ncbi:MAG: glycosyltransferase [Gilvibacter sp.]